MKRFFLILCSCLFVTIMIGAATVDTGVRIFDSKVRTLRVAPLSNPYMPPVIVMNSGDRIRVVFDYLDYDVQYLRYSVTHCNADWQPSMLVESEYVDGFDYADINDYECSRATFQQYCNYSFEIPNDEFVITKSGNYLLTVYQQDDPDRILFQTRFSICERMVDVMPEVTSRTDVDYNSEHQQVAVKVNYRQGDVNDPYNDLTLVVGQNMRQDQTRFVTKPMMVGMGEITYDHNPLLIFEAGNEYRRFETVNTNTINMGVAQIKYYEPFHHATLLVDEPRANLQYLYDQTQFGHFTVRNAESDESNIEADYLVTHFTLNTGGPLEGGQLLLDGEFLLGMPSSMAVMKYDAASGCYVSDLLLKQGSYNYQYLWLPDGTDIARTAMIEGAKYQTVNQYPILVYYHPSGARYDRLVGYAVAYSGK